VRWTESSANSCALAGFLFRSLPAGLICCEIRSRMCAVGVFDAEEQGLEGLSNELSDQRNGPRLHAH